ncbi:TetR/AcrR family transcriptional regulator [Blautia schinkii]|nr:TetR/AcrR family transcriptional regulator [Blautia schinkii]
MKNEEISLETKKALAASLKKAMKQKAFSKITVKEIITDCGVNRNTFYYHFEDIYALLRWMLTEEAIEVVKHFDLLVDYEDAIRFVMNYVNQNDYIISCAYNSIGRDEMKRFFYSDFIEITSTLINSADEKSSKPLDPDFKKFLAEFYTEALAGILVNWATDRQVRDKEKTISYLTTIIHTGLSYFN